MEIRAAQEGDFNEIMRVYRAAKSYMDATGNDTQWEVGYPSEKMVREDIFDQKLYVITEKNEIHAVFYFFNGADEVYQTIYDGAWLNDAPYGVLHRVASDGKLRGVVRAAVEFAWRSVQNLRIDTHEKNRPMQEALARCGFVRCGIICLPNGDPRIAYQLT